MMIAVNGKMRKVELSLSGRSSELFSPGKGWVNIGVFGVLLDDRADGNNEVFMNNNMAIGVSEQWCHQWLSEFVTQ
jgi:alpha-galactosidase